MTTENLSSASSSQSTFSIGFTVPTDTSEIQVYVEDATTGVMTLQTAGTDYNIVGTEVVFTSGNEPPAGTDNVQILRNTDVTSTSKQRTFVAGSSIRAADLNANFTRLFDHAEDKIQTSDIANKAVTTAKIALGAVTTNRIAGSAVTTNKINASAVTAAKIGTDAVTSTKIQDSAVTSDKLASQAVTNNKIASDAVTTGKIADGAITSTKIAQQSIISNKINPLAVTTGKINDQAVTTAKIAAGAVTPAKLSETYLTQSEIINLVDDVGGFVPIANETSFPATNPDLNNGFGTLISIQEIVGSYNGITNNSMSAIDIPNGAGTGNTVTISGPASSFSFPQGYGAIVETTNTLHLYNLHRIVPKSADVTSVAGSISNVNSVAGSISNVNSVASNASNVNTVAGDISNVNTAATNIANINTAASNISNVNNFTEKYQIAASDPTTDGGGNALSEGDLYFNSTANQLKIYNGSTWQNGITAPSNTAYITGNTFTGDNTYGDNIKAKFGASNDIEIYSNGSHGFIRNAQGGQLHLNANSILIKNGANDESYIRAYQNGSVELYYDNVKKAETSADGLDVTSNTAKVGTTILSNTSITNHNYQYGAGGTERSGLTIKADEPMLEIIANNNSTHAGSILIRDAGNDGFAFVSDSSNEQLQIKSFTTSGDNFRVNGTGNNVSRLDDCIVVTKDGEVELYYDGAKKINTTSWGSYVNGTLQATNLAAATGYIHVESDNQPVKIGAGSDLSLLHDGTDSKITNITGNLLIEPKSGETGIKVVPDGAVELYYNGTKKAETSSTGLDISGKLDVLHPNTNTFSEIKCNGGTSGLRISGSAAASAAFLTFANNHINTITDRWTFGTANDGASSDMVIYKGSGVTGTERLRVKGDSARVEITGALNLSDDLSLIDSKLATFGTHNDLQIFHNGNNSFIKHLAGATGQFYIDAAGSKNIILRAGNGASGSQTSVNIVSEGQVALYFDGTKKFETTSNGWKSNDSIQGVFGTGDDLSIYHDGSNSYIKNTTGTLFIKASSGRDGIEIRNNGKVALFNQGVEKFRTTGTGTTTLGQSTATGAGIVGFKVPDNPTISNETTTHGLFMAGNGNDLIIGHDGTDSFITNDTGNLNINAKSGESGIKVNRDGAVELYYDGDKKFETTSNGAKIEKAGNAQLQLINTNTTGVNHCVLGLRSYTDDGDTKVQFGTSGSANRGELKYVSDQDKFQWRVGGGNRYTMTSTEFSPITNNNRALGNSSAKWSTLHSGSLNTGDIHMNNLDATSGNEVDGTKGSWSLQEGADDLFLINRVSGKKYKFNLTEIS